MTATLAAAGVLYNPAILAPAALFGVVTYFLWMHASGRLAARIYRRVEQQAAATGGPSTRQGPGGPDRRGGTSRQRAERTRGRRARRERTRRPNGGPRSRPDGASIARQEAREVLDVGPDANQERIREAYRERVKAVHPDSEEGDRETFKRVQDAYETLRE